LGNRLTKNTANIVGYDLVGEIGSGANSTVFKAVRNGKTFAIKVSKQASVVGTDRFRFRREVAALARMNHPGLVKVYDAGQTNENNYLITDFVQGVPLSEILASKGPRTQEQLLKLAISIARPLSEIHRHDLIHRDLKPANVMVNDAGDVTIIDLGFVTNMGVYVQKESEIIGSILYCSPEQLGLINRPLGAPSDLYSLGMILYECATGKAAFDSSDLAELIQMQLKTTPKPLHEVATGISPVLSQIIGKLLEKDPDSRYVTAVQLLADLEELTELDKNYRDGMPIKLGRANLAFNQTASREIVGREEEVKSLLQIWSQTQKGSGALALISGESGLGKSRLCQEILNVAGQEAILITTKCEEFGAQPFVCVQDVVDQIVKKIDYANDQKKISIEEVLRKSAGENEANVVRLFPSLAKIMSVKSDKSVSAKITQVELYEAATEFLIQLLKNLGQPVIWLLDDLQWIDESSFEVACRVSTQVKSMSVFVLCTTRNNEEFLEKTGNFRNRIKSVLAMDVDLKPLSLDAIGQLVHSQIGQSHLDDAVIEKIALVAKGNAYIVKEYVRSLVENGVLALKDATWIFDNDLFDNADLPEDATQLIRNRLKGLHAETLIVAQGASVIGMEFKIDVLSALTKFEPEMVMRSIAECIHEGLVDRGSNEVFRFAHDRVREAFYESIEDGARVTFHQAAAEFLYETDDEGNTRIFEVAQHYQMGIWKNTIDRAFETNLKAGLKSAEVQANKQALQYLQTALNISQESKSEFPVQELNRALGQVTARLGKLREAIQYYHNSLKAEKDPFVIAQINIQLLEAHVASINIDGNNNQKPAWEALHAALEILGVPVPKNQIFMLTAVILQWGYTALMSLFGVGFGRRSGVTAERLRLAVQVYLTGSRLAYFGGQEPMMLYFALRMYVTGYSIGTCRETASAYSTYSLLLAILNMPEHAKRAGLKSREIAEQLKNPPLSAAVSIEYGHLLHMCGEVLEAEGYATRTLKQFEKWALLEYVNETTNVLSIHQLFRGLPRINLATSEGSIRLSKENQIPPPLLPRVLIMAGYAQLGDLATAHGMYKNTIQFLGNTEKDPFTASTACVIVAAYLVETFETNSEVISWFIDSYYKIGFSAQKAPWHAKLVYCMIAHLRLRQFEAGPRDVETEAKFLAALKDSKTASIVPISKCHHYVALGAYYRIKGQTAKALKYLKTAEGHAIHSDSSWALVEIHRQRARIYRDSNDYKSRNEATLALDIANKSEMRHLAQALRTEFSLVNTTVPNAQTESMMAGQSVANLFTKRYVESLLRVSMASASTIDPKLQAKHSLDEIISILNAERAFVFVVDAVTGKLIVQAGRNDKGEDLEQLVGYSSTVIEKVRETKQPVIVSNMGRGEDIASESIVIHDLRSILAAPLELRGKFLGVVYADSRVTKGLFSKDDLELFKGISNHIAIAFESAKIAGLEVEKRAMEKDLELSATVQKFFLPRNANFSSPATSLAGFYRPATHCGGDWWWYKVVGNKMQIIVGDVTGHGAAPAMITASVASSAKAHDSKGTLIELPKLLDALNSDLCDVAERAYLMTMVALQIDFDLMTLNYWSAGGPGVLVLGEDPPMLLAESGTPLGLEEKLQLGHVQQVLKKNQRIFIFTDGITEMRTGANQLGQRRLNKILQGLKTLDPSAANIELVKKLDELRGSTPQDDDFTFIAVDVL
jgi:eukaryotic-like serine/threonine-protein kinase